MIFDKAAQQWVCANPLELVTGMRLCHLLMQQKVSSIIAGTVLVYERDNLILFQTSEILYIHYLTEESGVGFEKGSGMMLDSGLLKWENFDLDSFPPFSKCRLPTIMELEIYNRLCDL